MSQCLTQLNEEIAEESVFSTRKNSVTTKYRNIVEQDWFLKINRTQISIYISVIGHLTRYYTVAASTLMEIFLGSVI